MLAFIKKWQTTRLLVFFIVIYPFIVAAFLRLMGEVNGPFRVGSLPRAIVPRLVSRFRERVVTIIRFFTTDLR